MATHIEARPNHHHPFTGINTRVIEGLREIGSWNNPYDNFTQGDNRYVAVLKYTLFNLLVTPSIVTLAAIRTFDKLRKGTQNEQSK